MANLNTLQGYTSKLLRLDLEVLICNQQQHLPNEDLTMQVAQVIARKLERQAAAASANGAAGGDSRDTASLRVFFQASETANQNPKAYFLKK